MNIEINHTGDRHAEAWLKQMVEQQLKAVASIYKTRYRKEHIEYKILEK